MKKATIIILMVFSAAISYAQMISAIYRYNDLKGKNVIIRTDHTRSYFVTYFTSMHNKGCFIVKHGDDIRYFDMTECYQNTLNTKGYIVNDMQMLGNDCYFCGKKWYQTGEMIYYLDGSIEFVIDTIGFLGKFNADDVLSGTGKYEILEVESTKTMKKLAVFPGGATAVGITDSMEHSCLVELHETGVTAGVMSYRTRVLHSKIGDEVFMDVVHTSTKVTAVSRYNDPQNNNAYYNYFGLRTGSPMNMLGTNTRVCNYDTYTTFGNESACFTGLNPICLSSINTGEGVAVTYLMSALPWSEGKIVSYRIDVPGLQTTGIQYSRDNHMYSRIREAKFNMPMNIYTRMAILLEDTGGRSVMRFPYWNMTANYTDTILYSNSVKIHTIAPFQYQSGTLELAMGGVYRYNLNMITELRNYDIHGGAGFWINYSCQPSMRGEWAPTDSMIQPVTDDRGLRSYKEKRNLFFVKFNFNSHKVEPETVCD